MSFINKIGLVMILLILTNGDGTGWRGLAMLVTGHIFLLLPEKI